MCGDFTPKADMGHGFEAYYVQAPHPETHPRTPNSRARCYPSGCGCWSQTSSLSKGAVQSAGGRGKLKAALGDTCSPPCAHCVYSIIIYIYVYTSLSLSIYIYIYISIYMYRRVYIYIYIYVYVYIYIYIIHICIYSHS